MSEKLNCLIIEDEPIAAEILTDYIANFPFLNLIASCSDAIYGLQVMEEKEIDVLFLDIHLPKIKGLSFLRSLARKPQTILTTAYQEYALEAFEIDVVDYLLKPIAFDRFLSAVNRLERKVSTSSPAPSNGKVRAFHFFSVERKMVKIYTDEIQYIESLKDYVRIHTLNDKYIIRKQIGQMEELFASHQFIRVHRSYLIPLAKITSYDMAGLEINSKTIPIGRSYKLNFEEGISAFKKG